METKPAILVVCGKARKRSRTAEILYQNSPDATVWAAGVSPKADRKLREDDLLRADIVLVMEPDHRKKIESQFRHLDLPPIEVLHIPDEYEVMDTELASMLCGHVDAVLEGFSQGERDS